MIPETGGDPRRAAVTEAKANADAADDEPGDGFSELPHEFGLGQFGSGGPELLDERQHLADQPHAISARDGKIDASLSALTNIAGQLFHPPVGKRIPEGHHQAVDVRWGTALHQLHRERDSFAVVFARAERLDHCF